MHRPLFRYVRRWQAWLVACVLLTVLAPAVGAAGKTELVKSADGTPIAYDVHGNGATALVFVHGWSCDRGYWHDQLPAFVPEFKVVAIDLAGHGQSGLSRKAWTIQTFGDDVAAVVQKLDLPRVILIGHSMGGDVIVEAARRLPGRVAGLVWVDVYRQLGTPRTDAQLETSIAPFRMDFVGTTRNFVRGMFPSNADRALVERIATDMSSAPPDIALGAMYAAMSFDREIPRALRELKLPVIAINADYRTTDTASLKRQGVDVVVMPGVGHFLQLENPQGFNSLLRMQVDKLTRSD